MILDGSCPSIRPLKMAAAPKEMMRTGTDELASSSSVQELSPPPPGPSPALAFLDSSPWASPGPPLHLPSAATSASSFVEGCAAPAAPAHSSSTLPLCSGPVQAEHAQTSESAIVPRQDPSRPPSRRSPSPPVALVASPKDAVHLRVPAIASKPFCSAPCPSADLSRGYKDGSPVVVPLTEIERDHFDLRPYLSESVLHLDGLEMPRFRSVLGKNLRSSSDFQAQLSSTGSSPLWSCTVGGVEFVLSCALPAEEEDRQRLSRFLSTFRVHIVPGARVVQQPGSPACAWSNKDWCIGCGGDWHPLALCPLVVRVVREMVDKGMSVNFDDGFCMKCGYVGHTAGYCQARLDKTMYRVWQAYCSRKRRWSCLDTIYTDVQLPPLAKMLQAEGCSRDLPLPERRSPPLPLCVRCSRPTGEARELLQEVLEQQRCEEKKRLERERLQDDDSFPLTRSSTLTRLPEDLRLPEPAALAVKDPVRLLTCVSAWQNWLGFGSQELQLLGHQLIWQVRRSKGLPFGGFPELGFRIPRALPLHIPDGADEEAWRAAAGPPASCKRPLPSAALPEPSSRSPGPRNKEARRPSSSSNATSSRSSGAHAPPASSRRVVASGVEELDEFGFLRE